MTEIYSLGSYRDAVERVMEQAIRDSWAERIWAKDATLWKNDPEHVRIIANAMGWLSVAEELTCKTTEIKAFSEDVRRRGFTTACLLGMGGSSLCPEVCAVTFGKKPGYLDLHILDTTDPASILNVEKSVDPIRTLFIVASKSGGTIESASLQKHFYEKLKKLAGARAGDNFIAITDPGTPMEKLARDLGFLRIFLNKKDIGGRYSALSYFGLVPMALIGLDIDEILERAIGMMNRCRITGDPIQNPGLRLGLTLGSLARQGLDKLTFILAPEMQAFGYWVEQLVAESTGKEGLGILPIVGEAVGDPLLYRHDRVFVQINLAGRRNAPLDAQLDKLEASGHPVVRWELRDIYDLGSEFFLWEYATAAAGAVLAINPFDQPNVQESKDNTQQLIRQYRETGRFEEDSPILSEGPISLYCTPELAETIIPDGGSEEDKRIKAILASFFKMVRPHDYVALLAYIERCPANQRALETIRDSLRDKLKIATTIGFGPRFLHSTGQFHKGGTNSGLFLQITAKDQVDVDIPGTGYSFGTLKRAQAIGDMEALVMHGCRALRVHIDEPITEGLTRLAEHIA